MPLIKLGQYIPKLTFVPNITTKLERNETTIGCVVKDAYGNWVTNLGNIDTIVPYYDEYSWFLLSDGATISFVQNGEEKQAVGEYAGSVTKTITVNGNLVWHSSYGSPDTMSLVPVLYNNALYLGLKYTYLYRTSNNNLVLCGSDTFLGVSILEYPGANAATIDEYIGRYIEVNDCSNDFQPDVYEGDISLSASPNVYIIRPSSEEFSINKGNTIVYINDVDGQYEADVSTIGISYYTDSQSGVEIEGLAYGFAITPSLLTDNVEIRFSVRNLGGRYASVNVILNNSNPYNPGGTSGTGGGGGSFGKDENSVDITPFIPIGSSEQALGKAGLYTRYLLNRTELYTVGSILWSKNFLQGIEAALTKLFYASPAEMLIQLLSYPFNVEGLSPSLGTSQFVWGNYPFATDIGVVSVLNSPALQFDWGEVQLTEFWGSFLDYAPYTKIDLYLPFGVGFVPIDPNECVPGSIGVKTNFDMNTGAVIHTVTGKVTRNGATTTVIIGTYCGNAARQVPLISADISGKMLNVISTGVGLAVAGVQAGLATETPKINEWTYYDTHTGLSGTMYDGPGMDMSNAQLLGETFKSVAKQFPKTSGFKFATKSATALSAPTPVQRNGSFTSGVSGLGIQFPYIVVSRPDQSVPQQYGHHYGYPSNIYAQLSTLTGYTEVGSIHLENLKCTGEERNELDRLLKEGVFLGY